MSRPTRVELALVCSALIAGCDSPHTTVILDNRYAPSDTNAFVIVGAFWQAVPFTDPVLPGQSSAEQPTISASPNTAYVLVAPGWDPAAGAPPSSFLLLQSRGDFGLDYDSTLHIPVDDAHFVGNCAAGERLTQEQADFIAGQVFRSQLASFQYDARTCTTTATP